MFVSKQICYINFTACYPGWDMEYERWWPLKTPHGRHIENCAGVMENSKLDNNDSDIHHCVKWLRDPQQYWKSQGIFV